MNADLEPIGLLDFIPQASKGRLQSPTNLVRLADAFERAEVGPVAVFGTTPPQVGKTTLIEYGIARRLLLWPETRVGYISHTARYANKRSRQIKAIYRECGGVVARGEDRSTEWRTGVREGGLLCGGVDGDFTGESLDLVVIDDPIRGRAEAESGAEREHLWGVFTDTIQRRFQPWTSIVVIHTRWTTDDLGGRLIGGHRHPMTGLPYEHIRIPALGVMNGEEVSLHPQRFSTAIYLRTRKHTNAYSWHSLYMGQPVAPGGRLFEDCKFYGGTGDRPLPAKLRRTLGMDCAYTAKTHADWSAAVELGFDDTTDPPDVYVLRVIREQVQAPAFAARLVSIQQERALLGVDFCWYAFGPEKGLVDMMRMLGVGVDSRHAAADKRVRAMPFSGAWNAGRVYLPRQSEENPWVDDFIAEYAGFTGVGDAHDDQVDAGAAAYDSNEHSGWEVMIKKLRETGRGWLT